jgi:hypothetical protein
VSSELDRIRERARQNRTAFRQTLTDTRAEMPTIEARLGCTFCAGARVLDRVTGEIGVVIGGTVENVVVPTARR